MSRLAGHCLAYSVCGLCTFGPDAPFSCSTLKPDWLTVEIHLGTRLWYFCLTTAWAGVLWFHWFLINQQLSVNQGPKGFPPSNPCISPTGPHALDECVLISEMKCAKSRSHYRWCDRNHFALRNKRGRSETVRSCYWKREQLLMTGTKVLHHRLYS